MTTPPTRTYWYAACESCTAKWFAPFRPLRCPRCGCFVGHAERRSPPWMRDRADTIATQDAMSRENEEE
ncbi:MAG: hypothetical protein DWQ35_16105 [Planctomycetota bacterium]|nr:MAG: hypothetical protein DWQ35_16105 [Planctomycetota bacterium]REK18243.1 MAG: hypothetical protein DWQ42_20405 [Planctomycetota bacterium]REK49113.1 MAG: hypothetical protein DWQ46_01005 [Planctomycetota bacterium]